MTVKAKSERTTSTDQGLEVLEEKLEVGSSNTSNGTTYHAASKELMVSHHTVKTWIQGLMESYGDRCYVLVVRNSKGDACAISPQGMDELRYLKAFKDAGGKLSEYLKQVEDEQKVDYVVEGNDSALAVIDDAQIVEAELVEETERANSELFSLRADFEDMFLSYVERNTKSLCKKARHIRATVMNEEMGADAEEFLAQMNNSRKKGKS